MENKELKAKEMSRLLYEIPFKTILVTKSFVDSKNICIFAADNKVI
jgi:hypothetical protein